MGGANRRSSCPIFIRYTIPGRGAARQFCEQRISSTPRPCQRLPARSQAVPVAGVEALPGVCHVQYTEIPNGVLLDCRGRCLQQALSIADRRFLIASDECYLPGYILLDERCPAPFFSHLPRNLC